MFESDRASIYLSKNFGEFSLVKGVINKSFFLWLYFNPK